jgi:tetratricopeptide (TPR) repeat protein
MKNLVLILMFLVSVVASDFIYSQRGGDDRVKRIKTERKGRIDRKIVRERVTKTKIPVKPKKRYIHRPPERPRRIEISYPVEEKKGFTICGDVQTPLHRNIDTYIHVPTKESGIHKLEMEDFEGAISDFTIVIEEDPYDKELYYYRGFAYNKIEQFDTADIDLSNAIYLDYSYIDAYFQRGIARVNLGDTKSAIKDFHTADSLKLVLTELAFDEDY